MRGALALASCALAPIAAAQLPPRLPRDALMDRAAAAVGAPIVWERQGLSGAGATLCLVDTGVDASHADLRDDLDRSRVLWVLDRTAPARGRYRDLERAFEGAVWSQDEIDLAPGDSHGHGTAMASIALGDDETYRGLAPAASLVVVRAWHDGFADDDVLAGVRFCRAIARSDPAIDPRRVVVLLALGGHDGAHDGRGAFERALAQEAELGPIVTAAGNDEGRPIHAYARPSGAQIVEVDLHVPAPDRTDAALALTIESGRGSIAIEAPSGARSAWLVPSAPVELALGGASVRIAPTVDRAGVAYVQIDPIPGTWRLLLRGPDAFDVWLARAELGHTFFSAQLAGDAVVSDGAVTIPGTTPELVTVGAMVSRALLSPDSGGSIDSGAAQGARAPFSARGPTIAGAPAPDVGAPGAVIVAALSSQLRPGADDVTGGDAARVGEDHFGLQGTSCAAAIVAGALLLALERAPDRAAQMASLVAATAGPSWTPDGSGVLDVPALIDAVSRDPVPPAQLALFATREPWAFGDRSVWLVARAADAQGRPASGTLRVLPSFAASFERDLAGGYEAIELFPDAALGSSLRIAASIDGVEAQPIEIAVASSREDMLAFGGGACAIAPARGPCALFLLAFVALSRRARAGADRGRRS